MTKLSLAVVFALTVLMYPMESRAECNLTGTIVRIETKGTLGSTSLIYFRSPTPITSHYFISSTDKLQVIVAATVALALQTRVYISGDVTTCPTSGASRKVGNIRTLVLNP